MILTCPSCATSYFTPDDALGPNGRRVRCKACSHTWFAAADEPLELTAATAPVEPAAPEFGRRDETVDSLSEAPAPELPRAFRARAEQQRRLRRAAAHGAVWAGIASVFFGLLAAAWLFRVEVVELWPRAAAAYAAVGAPVNRTGLDFEAVSGRTLPHAPDRVLVSGALRNVRDREIVAPPVRVALLDAQGAELAHAVVRIDAAPVLPGKVQGFAVTLPDAGGKAAGIGVDFAAPDAAAAEPEPEPEPAPAPAAPRPRPVATAAEIGLRPAPPADSLPIDLQPVDAVPLDKPVAGALSPVHG